MLFTSKQVYKIKMSAIFGTFTLAQYESLEKAQKESDRLFKQGKPVWVEKEMVNSTMQTI